MSARPRAVDTGNTVTLLHHVFEAQMPDGETEEVFLAECAGGTSQANLERAKRRARRRWQERQQITGATTG